MITEHLSGIAVNSDALRALGEALSDIAWFDPSQFPDADWDEEVAAMGDRKVSVEHVQYHAGSRTVEDGTTRPLADDSFDDWPPAECQSFDTKFHVLIPEHYEDDGIYYLQTPYVSIEAGEGGWVQVNVWAEEGATALLIADAVSAVLKQHEAAPTPEQEHEYKVFIGHGGDRQWEVVRKLLALAGHDVVAFESDERAGFNTLDVVSQMIHESAVAVVIMTGSDELTNGSKLARQNVVHEIGFAQAALGVANTIILLEEGTEEFTNIAGLTQIRFRKGEVHTTESRVLAAIARCAKYRHGGC